MYSRANRRRIVQLYGRNNENKYAKAALMRNNPTPAEERMWDILTKKIIPNYPKYKFSQQYVLLGYILDFYSPTLKICIEIDGEIHDYRRDYDEKRDKYLKRNGIVVFHFRNEQIFNTPIKVAKRICRCIEAKTMH